MVVHLAAEPKHLLRLVPVELSLSLGHPALLLALQLLAEGHAERSEAASPGDTSRHKRLFERARGGVNASLRRITERATERRYVCPRLKHVRVSHGKPTIMLSTYSFYQLRTFLV